MSDNEGTLKGNGAKGSAAGWTEHEVLVYLLSAIEHSNLKIDFAAAPVPFGRNANGCSQKFHRIKHALRSEIDALKSGEPFASSAEGTPKKTATPRKRKLKGENELNENADGSPKKRGRPKKNAQAGGEEEINVKIEKAEEKPEDEP
ncbi:hypothetical protein BKA66DRAFT_568530 [Pyrenochaeta sp. MPI-SDFR-AT-0127]|nr:hypothetical protein BKA66DRAFT_568530 [Pyrenochaeta sp. MPI-SDFR-AT-0127]